MCCFSRWAWLIPIRDKSAKTIADGLLRIFCDAASFPVVLRSDNAAEFVGDVVKHMNKVLSIKHITGSAYHPQSQGAVESMHKTLNQVVRGVIQDHPEDWEEALKFATFLLRSSPMECLGGRSPMEVVTGLRPRVPVAMTAGLPVSMRNVDDYVKDLVEHLKGVHQSVQRVKLESLEREEKKLEGRLSAELQVGDAVLVRREPTVERKGPTRFQERVYDGVFVIKNKISPTTFEVEDLADKAMTIPFTQPLHAERLVKLDMPELELSPTQPRRLEMRERETQPWNEYTIERFAPDGRVSIRHGDGEARWVDLSRCEYRWLE